MELALSTTDIRRIRSRGKLASLLGMEGGHGLENALGALREMNRLGGLRPGLDH